MRFHILRALLRKEIDRHRANRGGILLAALLVVVSLLMTVFGKQDAPGGLGTGVQHCFVDYWEDGPWLLHLSQHVPKELKSAVRFRHVPSEVATDRIMYPPGSVAIQIRPLGERKEPPYAKIWFWHPQGDAGSLGPFEAWFWRETFEFYGQQARAELAKSNPALAAVGHGPLFDLERSAMEGGMNVQSGVATALVLFALFFICVYLLPSLTCEERERGVLLAQALSPASSWEILFAKFFFYPALGMVLAAILAGVQQPQVLKLPFFWLALTVAACGSLAVGLTIASIARTQRTASMGALCYMMVVALLLFVCQQSRVPLLPYFALEYHCPRMIHAAMSGAVYWYHWANLIAAGCLTGCWAVVATILFRRYGWQ